MKWSVNYNGWVPLSSEGGHNASNCEPGFPLSLGAATYFMQCLDANGNCTFQFGQNTVCSNYSSTPTFHMHIAAAEPSECADNLPPLMNNITVYASLETQHASIKSMSYYMATEAGLYYQNLFLLHPGTPYGLAWTSYDDQGNHYYISGNSNNATILTEIDGSQCLLSYDITKH